MDTPQGQCTWRTMVMRMARISPSKSCLPPCRKHLIKKFRHADYFDKIGSNSLEAIHLGWFVRIKKSCLKVLIFLHYSSRSYNRWHFFGIFKNIILRIFTEYLPEYFYAIFPGYFYRIFPRVFQQNIFLSIFIKYILEF